MHWSRSFFVGSYGMNELQLELSFQIVRDRKHREMPSTFISNVKPYTAAVQSSIPLSSASLYPKHDIIFQVNLSACAGLNNNFQ